MSKAKLTDWQKVCGDVERTAQKVMRKFAKWYPENLKIIHGNGRNVEEIFGFPYTSSGSYAGIWNCQAEATYKFEKDFYFDGLAITEDRLIVALFSTGEITENGEMEIIIGGI